MEPSKAPVSTDADPASATLSRERLMLKITRCLYFAASIFITLSFLLSSSRPLLSLFVAIVGAACFGVGSFNVLAVLWRRLCGRRGHDFRELDVFPDGSAFVYECRHCGERRFTSRAPERNA